MPVCEIEVVLAVTLTLLGSVNSQCSCVTETRTGTSTTATTTSFECPSSDLAIDADLPADLPVGQYCTTTTSFTPFTAQLTTAGTTSEPAPTPVPTTVDPSVSTTSTMDCPWLIPTVVDDQFECVDGTVCNHASCCQSHGGRSKCPRNWPVMCVEKTCGGQGVDSEGDNCCASQASQCELGILRCETPSPTPEPTTACTWLTPMDTNDFECVNGAQCPSNMPGCCKDHGGRARCPADYPKMCSDQICGDADRGYLDYCCRTQCEDFVGERDCSTTATTATTMTTSQTVVSCTCTSQTTSVVTQSFTTTTRTPEAESTTRTTDTETAIWKTAPDQKVCSTDVFVDEDPFGGSISGTLFFGGAQSGGSDFSEQSAEEYRVILADRCKHEVAEMPAGWPKVVGREARPRFGDCCWPYQYFVNFKRDGISSDAVYFVIQVRSEGRYWRRGVTVEINDDSSGDTRLSSIETLARVSSARTLPMSSALVAVLFLLLLR